MDLPAQRDFATMIILITNRSMKFKKLPHPLAPTTSTLALYHMVRRLYNLLYKYVQDIPSLRLALDIYPISSRYCKISSSRTASLALKNFHPSVLLTALNSFDKNLIHFKYRSGASHNLAS
ncbi:hypothetical protein C5167_007566 [Papaver somniferum]|nr:hypothetical protein C5167_007566 [Papaver somniferum]